MAAFVAPATLFELSRVANVLITLRSPFGETLHALGYQLRGMRTCDTCGVAFEAQPSPCDECTHCALERQRIEAMEERRAGEGF